MKRTVEILKRCYSEYSPILCYSGGRDSGVLLDIVAKAISPDPFDVLYVRTRMEHPETESFVDETVASYGATLHVAESGRHPTEIWDKQGWPFLGKGPAAPWNRRHKGWGFKLRVCCEQIKAIPGRRLSKRIGKNLQVTGMRGNEDDAVRGWRSSGGTIRWVDGAGIHMSEPLAGWTATMVDRYSAENSLPEHPARRDGTRSSVGCVFCGGGASYSVNPIRESRIHMPREHRKFILLWKAGCVMLSIKYNKRLSIIERAVERCGGVGALLDERPWIFDYTRSPPLRGYVK